MIVAIDGTTASGKGTLAKQVATWRGLPYLDTGLLYRATAAKAFAAGQDLSDATACAEIAAGLALSDLQGPNLRGSAIGAAASVVAAHGEVRRALFALQRAFARQAGGAVLDGRDIGTVIAPDAEIKLWVDAAVEVRAERRWRELRALGEHASLADVLVQLKARDARDAGRTDAPMKPAADARSIDTSELAPDAVFAWAKSLIEGLSPV